MAPPISEFSRQLQVLEQDIKKLEIEYQNFSLGRTPKLPWEMRSRIENVIKQYDRLQIQNTAERFRFQGLQMKFSTFCERWERDLKLRELGRPGPMRGRPAEPAASASPRGRTEAAAGPARPGGPIAVRDLEADAEQVRALHQQFNDARRRTGEAEVPFDRFSAVVRSQVEKLGSQGGGVAFRVREQDGRVSFTAKVADDESD